MINSKNRALCTQGIRSLNFKQETFSAEEVKPIGYQFETLYLASPSILFWNESPRNPLDGMLKLHLIILIQEAKHLSSSG
jgi:hypothetical protein